MLRSAPSRAGGRADSHGGLITACLRQDPVSKNKSFDGVFGAARGHDV
jgi:hypothetical protein